MFRSNGHDSISSELLKLVNIDISDCHTLIINQSLRFFAYIEKQTHFNRYRNNLKKIMLHAKRSHYKDLFEQFRFDMKKTWTVISKTLNKNVRNPIPDNIVINGVDCSDKQLIADNFNNFLASIGKLNVSSIGRHYDSSYQDYLPVRTDSNFSFHSINRNYIIQIIKHIKLFRSNGHDSISSELLKLVNIDISDCHTLIINKSLRSGMFPDQLKIA